MKRLVEFLLEEGGSIVVEKLRSIGNRPDEIEISFGVKLSTVAGAIIASAKAEANFDVTVRWIGTRKETAS